MKNYNFKLGICMLYGSLYFDIEKHQHLFLHSIYVCTVLYLDEFVYLYTILGFLATWSNVFIKILRTYFIVPARFDASKKNFTVLRGHNISMDCQAIGDKPISVSWNFNNKTVGSGNLGRCV